MYVRVHLCQFLTGSLVLSAGSKQTRIRHNQSPWSV